MRAKYIQEENTMTLVESALFALAAQDMGLYEAKQAFADEPLTAKEARMQRRAESSQSALDELIKSYMKPGVFPPDFFAQTGKTPEELVKMAVRIASRVTTTLPPGERHEYMIELIQELMGRAGKIMAEYNPEKGAKSGNWIMNGMEQFARDYMREVFRRMGRNGGSLDSTPADGSDNPVKDAITHGMESDDDMGGLNAGGEPDDPNGLDPARRAAVSDARNRVGEILSGMALSPTERKVITLQYGLDGEAPKSGEEIAEILGITHGSARELARRALNRFRVAMVRNPRLADELRSLMQTMSRLGESIETERVAKGLEMLLG